MLLSDLKIPILTAIGGFALIAFFVVPMFSETPQEQAKRLLIDAAATYQTCQYYPDDSCLKRMRDITARAEALKAKLKAR